MRINSQTYMNKEELMDWIPLLMTTLDLWISEGLPFVVNGEDQWFSVEDVCQWIHDKEKQKEKRTKESVEADCQKTLAKARKSIFNLTRIETTWTSEVDNINESEKEAI